MSKPMIVPIKLGVGPSRIIQLQGLDGEPDGYSLEVHRLLDGTLIIRIVEPGQRVGIGLPGTGTVPAIATALAKSEELKIPTRTGYYRIGREQAWAIVGYFAFEGGVQRVWKVAMPELLFALKSLGQNAA